MTAGIVYAIVTGKVNAAGEIKPGEGYARARGVIWAF
jgi:hypothetical protein